MKKLILLSGLFVLSACSLVDDFNQVLEHQKQVQAIVKERYGLESQFGFNVSNGELVQVTLNLNVADVRDKTVSELEQVVAEIVPEVFEQKPQQVLIIIRD